MAPQIYDLTIDKCSYRYRTEPKSLVCISHKHETLSIRDTRARKDVVEQRRKKEDEAARIAKQRRKDDEAARIAEERRKKDDEAAQLAEQQRKDDEAARLAELKRKNDEAASIAEKKEEEARLLHLAQEKKEEAERERLAKERLENAERMIVDARKQTADQLEEDNNASGNFWDGLKESAIDKGPEIIFEIGKMIISSMLNAPQTTSPNVKVKGYTKKNGTKVAPYSRSAPKK